MSRVAASAADCCNDIPTAFQDTRVHVSDRGTGRLSILW